MAKVLLSVTATRDGRIEAVYERESLGAVTPTRKDAAWPASVQSAAAALIKAADDLSQDDPSVVEVQVYGKSPATDHAGAGEIVDVKFSGGSGARAGDVAAVPSALASARDAFKSAVSSAL